MSSLKTYLRSKLSPVATERVKILSDSYKALRRTFTRKSQYPVCLRRLRDSLEQRGLGTGDHLLVHSSLTKLSTRSHPPTADYPYNPFHYASALIQLLCELVGRSGSIWMPTDSGIGYENAMRGVLFDFRRSPSSNGLITELFRRRRDVVRDTYPFQNLTGWGEIAFELITRHEKQFSPYPMDLSSPWFQLQELGAKVLFLGTNFENNSSLHLVEYVHHAEYPTGIFFHKPFTMKFLDRSGQVQEQPIYIHPLFRKPHAATRFCTYLDQKDPLYDKWRLDEVPLTIFSLNQQSRAVYREMQQGITLYHPMFWS